MFIIHGQLKPLSTQKNEIHSNFYTKISDFINFDLDNSFLLNSYDSISQLKCFLNCRNNPECFYISIQQKKCLICKRNLTLFLNDNTDGVRSIYQKNLNINSVNGLINYWAFNGNVNDLIWIAHLYGGVNAALTFDRLGRPDSALSLTNGYFKVPSGVYFTGSQFTIMVWVKVRKFSTSSRVLDFGNGADNENIVFQLSNQNTGKPKIYFKIGNSGSTFFVGYATKTLKLNEWQHLACGFSFPNYFIYIDGIEVSDVASQTSLSSFNLNNVVRNLNFIGSSNWYNTNGGNDQHSDADFDDLKIFN